MGVRGGPRLEHWRPLVSSSPTSPAYHPAQPCDQHKLAEISRNQQKSAKISKNQQKSARNQQKSANLNSKIWDYCIRTSRTEVKELLICREARQCDLPLRSVNTNQNNQSHHYSTRSSVVDKRWGCSYNASKTFATSGRVLMNWSWKSIEDDLLLSDVYKWPPDGQLKFS